ncbi:MAG: hypothetical protein ACOYM3_25860, partial [Terrimicrobiaceae bacterium]
WLNTPGSPVAKSRDRAKRGFDRAYSPNILQISHTWDKGTAILGPAMLLHHFDQARRGLVYDSGWRISNHGTLWQPAASRTRLEQHLCKQMLNTAIIEMVDALGSGTAVTTILS